MTRSTTLGKRVNVYLPAGEWDRIMALADRLRADGWRVTDMRGVVTFATVVRALADAYEDAQDRRKG